MAVLDGLDHRGRDIGDDIAAAEIAGPAPQPDDIGLELADAAINRHVEGGDGGAVDRARRRQADARLEAAHARLDIGVIDAALAGRGIEIARDDQPAAQRHDTRPLGADTHPVRQLDLRPTTARGEVAIGHDRLLGRLQRLGREHRRRGARHGVAGAGIIALAPLGLLGERRCSGSRGGARKQSQHGFAAGQAQLRHLFLFKTSRMRADHTKTSPERATLAMHWRDGQVHCRRRCPSTVNEA